MKIKKVMTRKQFYGLVLIFPALFLVCILLFLPTINTIINSFTDCSFIKGESSQFVGFSNYLHILKDDEFISSLRNTFLFSFTTVFFELILGILLALVINQSFAARGVLRTIILFPWILPTALNAITWRWLYNTDFGFFNSLLYSLGIVSQNINWLGRIPLSMISMMVVAIWKTSSFMALIILTGLQTIPKDIYDAARIDGANSIQYFQRIILPLIVPSIVVALLFRSMDAFRAFELPFSLTHGGPAGSTQTLSLFGYRQFFQFLKFGSGSAVSVIQFILFFIIALLYLTIFFRRSER